MQNIFEVAQKAAINIRAFEGCHAGSVGSALPLPLWGMSSNNKAQILTHDDRLLIEKC